MSAASGSVGAVRGKPSRTAVSSLSRWINPPSRMVTMLWTRCPKLETCDS